MDNSKKVDFFRCCKGQLVVKTVPFILLHDINHHFYISLYLLCFFTDAVQTWLAPAKGPG